MDFRYLYCGLCVIIGLISVYGQREVPGWGMQVGWGIQTTTPSWRGQAAPSTNTEHAVYSQYQPSQTSYNSFGALDIQGSNSQSVIPSGQTVYQNQINTASQQPSAQRQQGANDAFITYGAGDSIHIQLPGKTKPSTVGQTQQMLQVNSNFQYQSSGVSNEQSLHIPQTNSNFQYQTSGVSNEQSQQFPQTNSNFQYQAARVSSDQSQQYPQTNSNFQYQTSGVSNGQSQQIPQGSSNFQYQTSGVSNGQSQQMPQGSSNFQYQTSVLSNKQTAISGANEIYQPQIQQPQQEIYPTESTGYRPQTTDYQAMQRAESQTPSSTNTQSSSAKNRALLLKAFLRYRQLKQQAKLNERTSDAKQPSFQTQSLVKAQPSVSNKNSAHQQPAYLPEASMQSELSASYPGNNGAQTAYQPQSYIQQSPSDSIQTRNIANQIQSYIPPNQPISVSRTVPETNLAKQPQSYFDPVPNEASFRSATEQNQVNQRQSFSKTALKSAILNAVQQRNTVNQPNSLFQLLPMEATTNASPAVQEYGTERQTLPYIPPLPAATNMRNGIQRSNGYQPPMNIQSALQVTEKNTFYKPQSLPQVQPTIASQIKVANAQNQNNKASSGDVKTNLWNLMKNFLRMQSVSDLKALLGSPNLLSSLKSFNTNKNKASSQAFLPKPTVYRPKPTPHEPKSTPYAPKLTQYEPKPTQYDPLPAQEQAMVRSGFQSQSNVQQLWSGGNEINQAAGVNQGSQPARSMNPTISNQVWSSTEKRRASDILPQGSISGIPIDSPSVLPTQIQNKNSVSSRAHFSSVSAGISNDVHKPKPQYKEETKSKYLRSSIGTAIQAVQNADTKQTQTKQATGTKAFDINQTGYNEARLTNTRGGSRDTIGRPSSNNKQTIIDTNYMGGGIAVDYVQSAAEPSVSVSKGSNRYSYPAAETSVSISKGSNSVFPYRSADSNLYQESKYTQHGTEPAKSAPWDSVYSAPRRGSSSYSDTKPTPTEPVELPPWEVAKTPAPLPIPKIPRPPALNYNSSGSGRRPGYDPIGPMPLPSRGPPNRPSGWLPGQTSDRPTSQKVHYLWTPESFHTLTTAATPTLPPTTTTSTTMLTTTLPPNTMPAMTQVAPYVAANENAGGGIPRPMSSVTTTKPKKKYRGPLRIRPIKQGDPPNWNAFDAVEPLEIRYVNDTHVCPNSRARWQDYTVYLETKSRLCMIQVTWNARYKREPIYHRNWWGTDVEYTYRTVYDGVVKFFDMHRPFK